MSFQQVSRALYTSIDLSPSIQRRLSLRADPKDCELRLAFNDFSHASKGGFYCGWARHLEPNKVFIKAGFHNSQLGLPRIGTRWRRMLICQPLIHRMDILPLCCIRQASVKKEALSSAEGLTIGDILDATLRVQKEHSTCL